MLTAAQSQYAATVITHAMMDTCERMIREGCDQKALWEATRDTLVEKFGFSLLAAANTTRLMIAAVAKRLGSPAPYSDKDLVTIHQIARAN